ncbi:cell growth regulator with RING finger domain protein 1 isoform X2 [Anguilla anguilla]|uniref:cell growth regulator with RING finger domain protein 1 isoform X2 n=1 Tax=Anguilla anguilla TaxID=7936 RepID=UPI0015AB1300|nr:cell growth regulator with RING finger domain protein 1 isoform X2 [Anguilla anguilla]
MAAVFLVMLFGFDVPVILRSSDDADSSWNIPEKRMVQKTNPFSLQIGITPSSVAEGMALRPGCLERCVLSCYWGCSVQALQAALHTHQHGLILSTPQVFQEALHSQYQHCQTFHVAKGDLEECISQMPADLGAVDFGLMPRSCYPLVALLTLADEEARDVYDIVANVTVVHVPDDKYRMSARILFQYLLTAQGNMFELKPLFMSAEEGGQVDLSGPTPAMEEEEEPGAEGMEPTAESEAEGEGTPGVGRDCVVCQNAPVNRVLLPCRHTCLCEGCVARFQHCPMCRAFVLESFALSQQLPAGEEEEDE